jgi:predicted thioesterase
MSLKGRTAEASLRILSLDSSDPAVLPISRLTALMELAAARLMKQGMNDGETSVALSFNLTHVAPLPASGSLRAVATHAGSAGRIHHFVVNVFGESGLVASAEYSRAVVAGRRLEGPARRRAGKRALPLAV